VALLLCRRQGLLAAGDVDAQPRAEIWYLDAARRVPEAITAKCPLCNCTWDVGRGVDALHPGAQAYYDSLVQLYAGWGVDLIKVDRRRRIRVRRSWPSPRFARLIAPWCSRPGGGMAPESAAWVADYAGGHKPMGSSPVGYPTKFTTADISIATSDVTAALAQQATVSRDWRLPLAATRVDRQPRRARKDTQCPLRPNPYLVLPYPATLLITQCLILYTPEVHYPMRGRSAHSLPLYAHPSFTLSSSPLITCSARLIFTRSARTLFTRSAHPILTRSTLASPLRSARRCSWWAI
jgi:hypothetical protein